MFSHDQPKMQTCRLKASWQIELMIHNSTKLTWKWNNNHIDSIDNIKRKGHDPQHSHNEEIWAGNSSPEFRPNDSQPVSVSKRRLAVVKWQEQCPYQLDLETPNISMSPINPARKSLCWCTIYNFSVSLLILWLPGPAVVTPGSPLPNSVINIHYNWSHSFISQLV